MGLGDTPQQAFAAYLAKLSGVTPANFTATISLDEATRISTIKSILADEKLTVVTPTSIQVPITFNEGSTSFSHQSDLDNVKKLISNFVKDFVPPSSNRILFWQGNNTVNLGTIVIADNIPELHNISIGEV